VHIIHFEGEELHTSDGEILDDDSLDEWSAYNDRRKERDEIKENVQHNQSKTSDSLGLD